MKHTLKTFPKASPWERANAYTRKAIFWKEAFERELRQRKGSPDIRAKYGSNPDGFSQFIDELLGDAE